MADATDTNAYEKSADAYMQSTADTVEMRRVEHMAFMENVLLEADVLRLQKEAAELQIRYYRQLLEDE